MRLEQGNWWRAEEPTPAEMAEGAKRLDEAGLKVDYIITHEPAQKIKNFLLMYLKHLQTLMLVNLQFLEYILVK